MNKFIFDVITHDCYYDISGFNSQEELENYIGEKVPVKYNAHKELDSYLDDWLVAHDFGILESNISDYNLDEGWATISAVYCLDNKCYLLYYKELAGGNFEILKEPREVYPIEKTVVVYE